MIKGIMAFLILWAVIGFTLVGLSKLSFADGLTLAKIVLLSGVCAVVALSIVVLIVMVF